MGHPKINGRSFLFRTHYSKVIFLRSPFRGYITASHHPTYMPKCVPTTTFIASITTLDASFSSGVPKPLAIGAFGTSVYTNNHVSKGFSDTSRSHASLKWRDYMEWARLLSGVESFEESIRNRKEYETLALELKTLSETLNRHLQGSETFPMLDFVVKTVESIQEQVDIIAKSQGYDSVRRVFGAQHVQEALATCNHYIHILSRQIQTRGAQQDVELDRRNVQLEGMKPAKLAMYDSSLATDINRRACTENTRTAVLFDLESWLSNPDAPNVCWMNGMAGTGKTTIAYTFAKSLEKRKQLAASFFCTRTTDECRDVMRIVPTIAYQLARCSSQFQPAICQVLADNPDLLSRTISTQFERLLEEPLLEMKDSVPKGLVVVIDALDECAASNGVALVLDILLRAAPTLPLKFFVASRPDQGIRTKIQEQPASTRTVYELHSVKQSDVQADIERYLRAELPSITKAEVRRLAELSGRLFIYAATAVRYIRGGNLPTRLKKVLSVGSVSSKGYGELDKLYRTILSAALNSDGLEEEEVEQMRQVLWTAVCAREPITIETLSVLAGINDSETTLGALEPFRSVLHVSETGNTVSTLHASFPDFIFSADRSVQFHCNTENHNQLLTQRCFDAMKAQLRFNICNLESSDLLDAKVPNIEERVAQTISRTLAYICRYWAEHLGQVSASDSLRVLLHTFLSGQLLFWMEVMNLKHWMGIGVRAILEAKLWLAKNYPLQETSRLAEDARNFVTSFAANAVSQSTPHIYISALALCHRSSTIYKCYWKQTQGLMQPKGAGIERREATILASWAFGLGVYSIAYSPDGSRLAIGCANGSIFIKDAHDGTIVGVPLTGHTGEVASVAFSPDGTRIVSGSYDHTIRVWSDFHHTPVSVSFEGHNRCVNSVAFSPDGTYVASGSGDGTIRLWNVNDGTLARPPFEGHDESVTSVAFSPSGRSIASGSDDCTIRLWDVEIGTLIVPPFKDHASGVTSIAFSSDGTRIASGSWDTTVRVWNVHNGTPVGPPLQGHAIRIASISFSLDGTYIGSGSWDRTVRVWNVRDGSLVGSPFKGHSKGVTAVAISPDSTRVVSGSFDGTIRVWNMRDATLSDTNPRGQTGAFTSFAASADGTLLASGSEDGTISILNMHDGTRVGTPLEGHTDWVNSVAFSANGTRIVSASNDNTIRIWRIQEGVLVYPPLQVHAQRVLSVAFSPDETRIVSGSKDWNVRTRNVHDGTLVGAPLDGHSNWVRSVTFSSDGAYIASGSDDWTFRVWNVRAGRLVGVPFQGHTNYVTSVAFSPDGTLIVSGSDDHTIRVWNVQGGTLFGAPFRGHAGPVLSVAFSPNGTHVVSGSWDCTIRVWNVQDGTLAWAPLRGHTSPVKSVLFSPDGAYVASSSKDSIRAWDLRNCKTEAETWNLTEDGWVRGFGSRLVFWLPQDLAAIFPTPQNLWAAGMNGPISLDYSSMRPGQDWRECYLTQ